MIKKFYNKNVLRAMGAVLMVCLMAVSSMTAATITAGATGLWSATGTWTGGVVPLSTDNVIVPTGVTVTIDVAVTISSSLKNTGGTVTIGVGSLTIDGTGTYEHAMNSGTIPIATWSTGSTFLITGTTANAPSSGMNQSFYHLTFNCVLSGNTSFALVNLTGESNTIRGNVTVNSTGTGAVRFLGFNAGETKTLTINGDLNLVPTSSNIVLVHTTGSSANTSTSMILNILGNLNIAGSSTAPATFSLNASSNVVATVNLGGNLTLSGNSATNFGLLTKSSGVGTFSFNKSGVQTFTKGSNTGMVGTTNYVVKSGSTLDLGTSIFSNTTVAGTLSGVANFTVEANAGLKIGDPYGITTGTTQGATVGNVQTAGTGSVRTFTAGSNYEYKGGAAQVTGSGLPATVNSLTINNSAGVTLSAATTVTNALTMTSGNLTLGAFDLTAGSFAGSPSTTSHVFTNSTGYLKSAFVGGDTKVFPIGAEATSYDPLSITPTNAVTFSAKVKAALSTATGQSNPTLILKKEWELVPSVTPGATNLAFTADAASLDVSGGAYAFPAGASAILGHWNSGTGMYDNIAASFASRTWTVTGYSGAFSPFIAASPGAVLPIELKNLAVKGRGTTNIVSWSTASEKDNATFNIERSANGQDFATIGTLKGNGTTTNASDYTFTDNTPLNGINYYRLRALDTDGKATVSKSVSILNGKTTSGILKAYPSVSTAILTVDVVTEGVSTLNIINIAGKTVLTKTIKDNGFSSNPMDVSGLSNGLYVLMFKSASVQMVQKFIKN